MVTRVYIPTRGRIGLNKQVTLKEFLDNSSFVPVLVCPPKEARAHLKYAPKVLKCPVKGIGPTRQWILERSRADIVVMADDDMRFSYREDPAVPKLSKCENLEPMMKLIERCVSEGFIHGGVGARQGNNRLDRETLRKGFLRWGHLFKDCDRVNNFHFMKRRAVLKAGARLDELPVMEDFHFTLTLLTKGHPNTVIHDYVWNQGGSGAEGGCSSYRTPKVQAKGAEGLHRAFPDYVKVVEKTSKDTSPSWKDFKTRKDVIIQWVKAAQDGGIDI